MVKIGVLALQGAVSEHIHSIEACGEADAIMVKSVEDLALVDGLILPGGESTTIRKLINRFEMLEPLRKFALEKPTFGTCAGLILLAKDLVGYEYSHIGALDATIERNSYGRQVDSFETDLYIENVAANFPAVFIRAPHIVNVEKNVEILAIHKERIVMVRQGHLLGCSFHPELTEDHRIMAYFTEMVKESLANEVHV